MSVFLKYGFGRFCLFYSSYNEATTPIHAVQQEKKKKE